MKLKIGDFLLIFAKLRQYDFCETSATFQGAHKMLPLPRLFTLCHVCAALTLRFMKTAPSPRHQMLRLPRKTTTQQHKVLHLPQNATRKCKACHKTQQKHATCDEIDLQHVILITFWERRPMVRLSALSANTCGRLRTRRSSNAGRTRL